MNHPDDRAPVAGDEVCANKGTRGASPVAAIDRSFGEKRGDKCSF